MNKFDTIKFILGASVVLTAICIMLPGVMGYAFSMARLGIIILVALFVSGGLAFLVQYLLKRKNTETNTSTELNTELKSSTAPVGADNEV